MMLLGESLKELNPHYVQILDNILGKIAKSYTYSFNRTDLEDIVAEARSKLLMYMPVLDSQMHAINWVNKFCKNYLLNAIRNFCNYNKKRYYFHSDENSQLLEKTACAKWVSDLNYGRVSTLFEKYLLEDESGISEILDNYDKRREELSEIIGLSRRQIYNKVRKLRNKIEKDLNNEFAEV